MMKKILKSPKPLALITVLIFCSTFSINSVSADELDYSRIYPNKIQNIETIDSILNSQIKDSIKSINFPTPYKINLLAKQTNKKTVSRNGVRERKIPVHRSLTAGYSSGKSYNSGRTVMPLKAMNVISGYGYRGRGFHHGIDISDKFGADVFSVFSGEVISTGWDSGYGKMVEIRHKNGLSTRYAHLSNILVKVGEKVFQGDVIGKVGNTGRVTCTHLHFEVRSNGISVQPQRYLR